MNQPTNRPSDFARKRRFLGYLDANPDILATIPSHDQVRIETIRKSECSCVLIVIVLEPQTDHWQEWCRTWVDPVAEQRLSDPPRSTIPQQTTHPAFTSFRGLNPPAERHRADLA